VGELREGVEIEVVRAGRWRAFVLQDSRTGQDLDESGQGLEREGNRRRVVEVREEGELESESSTFWRSRGRE